MKPLISKPINNLQREFNVLCEKGGGLKGGPARGKVLELLKAKGHVMNASASQAIIGQFESFQDANVWHFCFAMGLVWGHLAKFDADFTAAAIAYLKDGSSADLRVAAKFGIDRGPDPIVQSLQSGRVLFGKVTLPEDIPNSLEMLHRAQECWLNPIAKPESRPRYIGAWNATAMFMSALFLRPDLAATHKTAKPLLPPGGPVSIGLNLLHKAQVLSRPAAGTELDDADVELGPLVEDNALFEELCRQLPDWNMLDVHSGVYLLGTRHEQSGAWAGD